MSSRWVGTHISAVEWVIKGNEEKPEWRASLYPPQHDGRVWLHCPTHGWVKVWYTLVRSAVSCRVTQLIQDCNSTQKGPNWTQTRAFWLSRESTGPHATVQSLIRSVSLKFCSSLETYIWWICATLMQKWMYMRWVRAPFLTKCVNYDLQASWRETLHDCLKLFLSGEFSAE